MQCNIDERRFHYPHTWIKLFTNHITLDFCKMFTDRSAYDAPTIEFPSNWRKTLAVSTSDTQTDVQTGIEAEVQFKYSQDSETQTDDTRNDQLMADPETARKQLNMPSMVKFLVRATPLLEAELDAATRSRAFDGYKLIEDKDEADGGQTRKLYNLEVGRDNNSNSLDEPMRANALAWNRAGNVLAVGYGASEHEDWCEHATSAENGSALALWKPQRKDFDPGRPHRLIPSPGCLTVLRFSSDSGIVAGGCFTGEVLCWSLDDENAANSVLCTSGMKGHREKITGLEFLPAKKSGMSGLTLISSSLDSKMIIWMPDGQHTHELIPVKIFVIPAERLPRSLNVKSRSKIGAEVGISCFALNLENPDIFAVGAETGTVLIGSLSSENPAPLTEAQIRFLNVEDHEVKDPTMLTMSSHRGRVIDVKFSPFSSDILVSVGSDQEIRIHNLLQPNAPVWTLHDETTVVSAVEWSLTRPSVLAATTMNSRLLIFDLESDKSVPKVELQSGEGNNRRLTTSLASLAMSKNFVAAGDSFGSVQVWRLSSFLESGDSAKELAAFKKMFAAEDN